MVQSASLQINASSHTVIHKDPPPSKALIDKINRAAASGNVKKIPLEEGGTWEELLGLKTTESTAADGTVTKTITGSFSFIGGGVRGTTNFQAQVSFRAESYQAGQLFAAVDTLADAYETQRAALEHAPSVQKLDALYQERKEETASSFASMVDGADSGRIYRSIQALFSSVEAKYQMHWLGQSLGLYHGGVDIKI